MKSLKTFFIKLKKNKYAEYIGILAFFVFLTFILYPKVFLGTHIISSADFLFIWEPWRSLLSSSYASKNYVISDIVESHYPLLQYFFTEFKSGGIPTWYGLTGMGSSAGIGFFTYLHINPFFLISSLLSKFNFGGAMSFSVILLTLFRGVSTYLLLKEYKLRRLAALLGAVVFTFCLYNIVWGLDSITYISSVLPFLLLATERLFKNINKLNIFLFLIAYILVILGGFPSVIVYVTCFMAGYAIMKSLYRFARKTESFKSLLKRLFIFLLLGIATFGLLSIVLIPSIDIFTTKIDLSYREFTHGGIHFDKIYILRYLIPDLLGNPINYNYQQPPFQPAMPTNYSEGAAYVGAMSVFLACFSLLRIKEDKKVLYFAGVALGTFLVMFNIGPFLDLLQHVPVFNSNPNTRLTIIISFCLSILAAYGMDAILKSKNDKLLKRYFLLVLILAINVSGAAIFCISRITNGFLLFDGRLLTEVSKYFFFIINGFFLIYLIVYKEFKAILAGAALILLIFIDLYSTGKGYLPQIKKEDFFPSTKGIEFLQKQSSIPDFRILAFDEIFLSATSAYYRINSITSVTHYNQRWAEFTNMIQEESTTIARKTVRFRKYKTDLMGQVVDFAGIKYILDHKGARPLTEQSIAEVDGFNSNIELRNNEELKQTILIKRPADITEFKIRIDEYTLRDSATLTMEIVDENSNVVKRFDTSGLVIGDTVIEDTVVGPEIKNPGMYTLRIKWSKPTSNTVTIARALTKLYPEGDLYKNDVLDKGDLTFTLLTEQEEINSKYELVYDDEIRIYENKNVFDRTFLIHNVVNTQNEDESLKMFQSLEAESKLDEVAIVETASTPVSVESCTDLSKDKTEILKYESSEIHVKTNSACDSILVLTDLYDKDWKVYVNGDKKELLNADYLVRGVYLEEGENTVEFKYEPQTFVWGTLVSSLTFLGVLIYALPIKKLTKKR